MKQQNILRKGNRLPFLILTICFLLTIIGMIKTIFISFDMDEAYAIAQSYRIVQGDQLVRDMWEPHQFSSYLTTFFLSIYLFFFGTTTGIVVALRIFGTILHILLGVCLYNVSKKMTSRFFALFLVLIHLNFLPKGIQVPEFELMHYWGLLIVFLCGIQYYCFSAGFSYLVILGICMMLQILNYPTMILLYPFYMLIILLLCKQPLKEFLITTLSAIVPGLGFLIYLFCHMDLSQFKQSLSYILADPSHTDKGFAVRMSEYIADFAADGMIVLLLFIVFLVVLFAMNRIAFKKEVPLRQLVLPAFVLEFAGYSLFYVYGCLLNDQNQFYLQIRYLLLAIIGILIYQKYHKHDCTIAKVLLGFGIIPGIVSLMATILLTNMTVNVAYSKLFICAYSALILLYLYYQKEHRPLHSIYLLIVVLLCSLVVSKTVLIRVTGCLPVTINARMQQMTDGPLKGIYVLDELANHLQEGSSLLKEYVGEEDNLLQFGCENILYLYTDAQISAASVQGTSVFNNDFIDYFSLFPEKYPTAVLVDHTFKYNYGSAYSPYNYIMDEWILTDFPYTEKIEGNGFTLYITHQQ